MLLILLMLSAIFCFSGQSETRVQRPIRFTNFPLANRLHNAANPGDKNYIVSSCAIQLALSMLYSGTNFKSPTAEQIKKNGFDLGNHDPKRGAYIRSLIDLLTGDSSNPDEYGTVLKGQLFMAINKRFSVAPTYVDAIRRLSKNASSVITDDFGKDGQKVINTINNRISTLTDGMIKNFLPPGSLNSDTVLSLINAIYLRAAWDVGEPFRRSSPSKPMAFRLESGKLKNMTSLNGTVEVPYLERDQFQLIKLPLIGDNHRKFGMYIVLPKVEDGRRSLDTLETFVKTDLLNKILNITDLQRKNVTVTIPEFAFDYEDDLVDDLESLGIKDIFQAHLADFSRMTNARGLLSKNSDRKWPLGSIQME